MSMEDVLNSNWDTRLNEPEATQQKQNPFGLKTNKTKLCNLSGGDYFTIEDDRTINRITNKLKTRIYYASYDENGECCGSGCATGKQIQTDVDAIENVSDLEKFFEKSRTNLFLKLVSVVRKNVPPEVYQIGVGIDAKAMLSVYRYVDHPIGYGVTISNYDLECFTCDSEPWKMTHFIENIETAIKKRDELFNKRMELENFWKSLPIEDRNKFEKIFEYGIHKNA